MSPNNIGENPSVTAVMQPTSSVDITQIPAAIMFAALSDAMLANSAAHSKRDMAPTQPSPSGGKRKRFSVAVKAVDDDVQPDWAKERKHAKHHHTFDSNGKYDKLKMAPRQPSPPSGKRKRFTIGVRVPDDDVEPDHAKNHKHAKHSHDVVMDAEVSFCAGPVDLETIMKVDDPTFMDWVILNQSSPSKESATSCIDVEMSDYVMIDTPPTDVEMSDNDVVFHDFDINDEIELRDVVLENSLMCEPEVESPSEDEMVSRNDSFDDLHNTTRNAPIPAAIIWPSNPIMPSHSTRDNMILDTPVPAGRFKPFNFLMPSQSISNFNAMNEPTKADEPRATCVSINADVPTMTGNPFVSPVASVPVPTLEDQASLLQPEAPRKRKRGGRQNAASVRNSDNMIPGIPTPAGGVRPSEPIVPSNSISSSNAMNVPIKTDEPKSTIISQGMDVSPTTGTPSKSTATNIPEVAMPKNQPSPVQPAAPRKGNGRARRNAVNAQDLDNMTPDTPTPAVKCKLSKATASSKSVGNSNPTNVPLGTDKPKTTITPPSVGAPTTTSTSSTSTTTKIPEANVPGNQQVPAEQEPPREGRSRVRRSDASLHDLLGEHMSATRYQRRRRSW
ncbi:hypothetical protein KJ359_010651 [Pestalotiopsis sp. 9143b]|nr:hypothetical protein KJ359_010651 [Pestalotiopsis sp. 9143b]